MAPGKPQTNGLQIGRVFLGKYRVDAILGSGGMGVVAQCTHLQLGEKVAVKMLRNEVLGDADAVERFTREAQAAAKLKSEHVAHVSDVGTFEDGVPYMVMEFLEGLDLDQLIDQRGNLPVPWTVDLMLQAAEALAEAHSIGIVHRDIKPSNLFVTWRPDGSSLLKVLDFGISKSAAGADLQLTQTQSLLGTPAYMSPEQMRSARLVDGRTDIWSLGTVMYEVLEGRKPFEAESFSEMCVKVAVDPPAALTNTPLGLQAVILRCLAKMPEQRYGSMAELANDLIPFAQDRHQAAMVVERMFRVLRRSSPNIEPAHGGGDAAPPTSPPAYIMPTSLPTDAQTIPSRPRKRWLPWVLLVGIAAVVGTTIGVVASAGPSSATATPTPPPKTEPKTEPKIVEPKLEPKIVEPKLEPKIVEPKLEPKIVEPKVEPPRLKKIVTKKTKPPHRVEPPKVEPPKVEPPKVEPPKIEPKANVFDQRQGTPVRH